MSFAKRVDAPIGMINFRAIEISLSGVTKRLKFEKRKLKGGDTKYKDKARENVRKLKIIKKELKTFNK
jgi:hypothetical protein